MSTSNAANNLLNIESLVKSHDDRLGVLTKELKINQEMLNSILDNNQEYTDSAKEASKFVKLKTLAKQKVLKEPASLDLVEKIKDYQAQIRELKVALSDYLAQYVTISGQTQIESTDGTLKSIVYTAKLVKKIN